MTALGSNDFGRLRVAIARAHQLIGWAGFAGIALLVAAAVVSASAWSTRATAHRHPQSRVSAPEGPVPAASSAALVAPLNAPALSARADIPLLVTQIEHAALANGLTWPAADYRLKPASAQAPASLEVRCTLKGPYPKVRGMLVQLLGSVPGFVLRDLSMSRATSGAADVEAKLAMAVFLMDGPVEAEASAKASR